MKDSPPLSPSCCFCSPPSTTADDKAAEVSKLVSNRLSLPPPPPTVPLKQRMALWEVPDPCRRWRNKPPRSMRGFGLGVRDRYGPKQLPPPMELPPIDPSALEGQRPPPRRGDVWGVWNILVGVLAPERTSRLELPLPSLKVVGRVSASCPPTFPATSSISLLGLLGGEKCGGGGGGAPAAASFM